MSHHLMQHWDALVPDAHDLGEGLLARWTEPHRDYHGLVHLQHGLAALDALGAGRLEYIAWWFHDAVHHNDTPNDEQASAALARQELASLLSPDEVDEVSRLILLTINHDPRDGDQPGQRLCDADLAMIATDPDTYDETVQRLRNERTGHNDIEWDRSRIDFTGRMLNRDRLFHTEAAHDAWEGVARANLTRERERLLNPTPKDPA